MSILLLALLCLPAATVAARNLQLMIVNNVTIMACQPLLGASLFQIFGYSSTVGNVFYTWVSEKSGYTRPGLVWRRAQNQKDIRIS